MTKDPSNPYSHCFAHDPGRCTSQPKRTYAGAIQLPTFDCGPPYLGLFRITLIYSRIKRWRLLCVQSDHSIFRLWCHKCFCVLLLFVSLFTNSYSYWNVLLTLDLVMTHEKVSIGLFSALCSFELKNGSNRKHAVLATNKVCTILSRAVHLLITLFPCHRIYITFAPNRSS